MEVSGASRRTLRRRPRRRGRYHRPEGSRPSSGGTGAPGAADSPPGYHAGDAHPAALHRACDRRAAHQLVYLATYGWRGVERALASVGRDGYWLVIGSAVCLILLAGIALSLRRWLTLRAELRQSGVPRRQGRCCPPSTVTSQAEASPSRSIRPAARSLPTSIPPQRRPTADLATAVVGWVALASGLTLVGTAFFWLLSGALLAARPANRRQRGGATTTLA